LNGVTLDVAGESVQDVFDVAAKSLRFAAFSDLHDDGITVLQE
jgi:hypothetical protein